MKRVYVAAVALTVLTACGVAPAPAPVPTSVPTPTVTLAPVVSPWDGFDSAWAQISVRGFPLDEPLDTLDPALLDALGEGEDMPAEEFHPPWTRKLYHTPGLELETAIIEKQTLDDMLTTEEGEGTFDQAAYDAALGTEYIYAVRLLDDTYETVPGLKIGDTIEQGRTLWYALEEGENFYHVVTFFLKVTVTDGVITAITSQNGGRGVGPLYW